MLNPSERPSSEPNTTQPELDWHNSPLLAEHDLLYRERLLEIPENLRADPTTIARVLLEVAVELTAHLFTVTEQAEILAEKFGTTPEDLERVRSKGLAIEDEIGGLYDSIRDLTLKAQSYPEDEDIANEISFQIQMLRKLQREEAGLIRKRYNESLEVPIGQGPKLIEEVERLLANDEDSPASDDSTERSNET